MFQIDIKGFWVRGPVFARWSGEPRNPTMYMAGFAGKVAPKDGCSSEPAPTA
jgi:hypothetical protein